MTDPATRAERAAVIAAIEAAFDGVALGDRVTLHAARTMGVYEPEAVRRPARRRDHRGTAAGRA